QNDAYGQAGLSGVTKALAAQQLKPLAVATVERNSSDVKDAVATLAKSGAQAIVQIGAYQACAAFIRQARAAGYGGKFYNVSFVGTQALADELGKDGAGVVVSQVVPSPYSAARPITREFVAAARQAGGHVQANYSSMEGYLAAKVFAEGLRRAARPSREGLIAALEGMNEDFGGYRVNFGAGQHVASRFVELSMLTGDGRVRT
ncbi:ABC transporter substrate-binding protein, partial [Ottowia sp.]